MLDSPLYSTPFITLQTVTKTKQDFMKVLSRCPLVLPAFPRVSPQMTIGPPFRNAEYPSRSLTTAQPLFLNKRFLGRDDLAIWR